MRILETSQDLILSEIKGIFILTIKFFHDRSDRSELFRAVQPRSHLVLAHLSVRAHVHRYEQSKVQESVTLETGMYF